MSNQTNLTIGCILPDGTNTTRAFIADTPTHASNDRQHRVPASATKQEPPRLGVEFHTGKAEPYRAYRLVDGVKSYKGDYAHESEAWGALTRAAIGE